jgi:hypothetical protein
LIYIINVFVIPQPNEPGLCKPSMCLALLKAHGIF